MKAAAALPLFILVSCDRGGDRVEIKQSRDLSIVIPVMEKPMLDASSERRLSSLPLSTTSKPLVGEMGEIGQFEYRQPNTWLPVEATRLRPLNFVFGPKGEGEVYVSMLPGEGGGVRANLDRWRMQMGVETLITDEEIATLPEMTFLSAPAGLLDVSGTFTDMRNPGQGKPGYRLLGVIQSFPGFTISAKLVGPEQLVDDHRRNFIRFCGSLNFRVTPAS